MHVRIFCVRFLTLFVSISLGILRKLPEDGRGSKRRKGHRDNIISYEAKSPISFEENNGKVFKHYKARDKKPKGQKTNKRGINHKKYSINRFGHSIVQIMSAEEGDSVPGDDG